MPGDVERLVAHFVQTYSQGEPREVSPASLRVLTRYGYPGNVEELQHIVQRAIAVSQNRRVPRSGGRGTLPHSRASPDPTGIPATKRSSESI